MTIQRSITIATFISHAETVNNSFLSFIRTAEKQYKLHTMMFVDQLQLDLPDEVKQILTPQSTKYKRILYLCNQAEGELVICIDNDIALDESVMLRFIGECLTNKAAFHFGKIQAVVKDGLVPQLVGIDKNLSHNFIRPFLWRSGLGLSIPGQVFAFDKMEVAKCLPNIDTVFDDLTLGISARKYGLAVRRCGLVLGQEMPKATILELARQRFRWARGFMECVFHNRFDKHILPLILVHGLAYHLLWVPVWIVLIWAFKFQVILGLSLLFVMALCLVSHNFKLIIWGLLYIVIFPFFHIIWLLAAIKNCLQFFYINS